MMNASSAIDLNAAGRIQKTINRDWKFTYFPSAVEDLAPIDNEYNDQDWVSVAVPHTWSTYETTGELHPFIRNPSEKDSTFWWYGWGWYRKTFFVDSRYDSRKIFLEFDGVQKYSKVWLNGHYIGEHKGGFTSFSLDITEAIRFEGENLLAIEVSNQRNDPFGGIPPMTAGNWNIYGGIYRDVRIVIKDRLHIPFQGSAEHEGGTFITTPELNETQGKVRIKTYVRNDYDKPVHCTLRTSILDADETLVASMEEQRWIIGDELTEFDQLSDMIHQPKLWSPESPYLYKVCSEVYIDNRKADQFDSPLGFRWFEWNYEENRLYLNGSQVHIHGSNRHQEYPWLGDAIPKWMHETDLSDIRFQLGFNFMRTCHYNQDPYVYDLCDRYGILICEEVPNIKNIEFGVDIQKQHVIEMIRRDRNHPSIIMWSMGNETNHAADPRWAYEEDETRIIHCRHCAGLGEDLPHTHKQMPMESLLRCTIRGWYNADVKPLEPANHQHAGHEEWQHDRSLTQDGNRLLAVNGSKWIYADHGCDREYLNSPLKHVNPKGWVDCYRMPKYLYYLWAANWSERPVMFIHPFDWTERYLGQSRSITVNSNCDEVVLKVNGEVVGTQTPNEANDYTVVFQHVRIERGILSAEGYRNGELIQHEVVMAGAPAKLVLSASHSRIPADRSGITLIKVDIVDESGVHVYGATNDLNFSILGPGKLVGPERYVSDINRNAELEGTLYIDTPVAVPIRSSDCAGTIRFTVSSEGLIPATIEIEAVQPVENESTGIIEPKVTNGSSVLVARAGASAMRDAGTLYPVNRLEESVEDIDFTALNETQYAKRVDSWIYSRNPQVNRDTGAYAALIELMEAQLKKDHGLTVADDYNFNIGHFNDCSSIVTHVQSRSWDSRVKSKLEKYYVDAIITRGMEMDVSREIEKLSSEKPWIEMGISLVEFGCCLQSGSFMPQTQGIGAGEAANPVQRLLDQIKEVHGNGYEFAELTVASLMKLARNEFDELKRRFREAKVTIPVFNSFIPPELKLTGPDVDWKSVEIYVDQAMKRVHALGGRQIIFGSGKARSIPEGYDMTDGMEQIKRFLKLCENYAAHYRITVAIEPLNRSECNVIHTVKEALALALELKLPHIAILADAYHMNLEKEPFSIVGEALREGILSHVHIAAWNRSFPQQDSPAEDIDLTQLFSELKKHGYEGMISFECSSGYERSGESIDYIRSLWLQAAAK